MPTVPVKNEWCSLRPSSRLSAAAEEKMNFFDVLTQAGVNFVQIGIP